MKKWWIKVPNTYSVNFSHLDWGQQVKWGSLCSVCNILIVQGFRDVEFWEEGKPNLEKKKKRETFSFGNDTDSNHLCFNSHEGRNLWRTACELLFF